MSAIDSLFKSLRSQGRKAFMPFVTAGDPDLEFTSALLGELVARGSGMCELGIPYSDPIADGPVIQASYTRAPGRGCPRQRLFRHARPHGPGSRAGGHMVSYRSCTGWAWKTTWPWPRAAGAAGPRAGPAVEECAPAAACRREDFASFQLSPPPPARTAKRIAALAMGHLLCFGQALRASGPSWRRKSSTMWPPPRADRPADCIGFGNQPPQHVRMLARWPTA